jgi:hypothetical protein
VPEAGREVLLRFNANRATGGIAVNVLDQVHPTISRYAELLGEATGFRTAGIDYVTPDISRSHEEVGGGFLEINATPGMVRAVLSGLVPPELTRRMIGPRAGRIPVALLIAPAPRLEEVAGKLLAKPDESTALATGSSGRIGSVSLPIDRKLPTDWVTALLRYKSVSALHILWTPEELIEWGLPVDSLDRVVTLGVSLDEPWSSLVADRSGEVAGARTAAEAVRMLRQVGRVEPGQSQPRPLSR